MKLTIHRGTREIGGNCIEIQSRGRRIFFDLGIPLVDPGGGRFSLGGGNGTSGRELLDTGTLPRISGVYQWDALDESVEGIVLSHAHLDHYGFTCHLHEGIRRYMGEGTRRLIEITGLLSGAGLHMENHAMFSAGRSFHAGPFEVTPFLMDHSAFDSYSFVIEDGEKRVIYSADFRGHGRKPGALETFLEHAPRGADVLILEGTLVAGQDHMPKSEQAVEKEIRDTLRRAAHIVFIVQSSQNIDRIVSFYKAARSTGRILVIDLYTAYILSRLKDLAGIPYPSAGFRNIRVFYPSSLCRRLDRIGRSDVMDMFHKFRINPDQLSENPSKYAMMIRSSMVRDIERIQALEGATVIYSLWKGYLEEESMKAMLEFMARHRMQFVKIHTSGHASIRTLQRVVRELKPEKIVPVHTFQPDRFHELFDNVLSVSDGEELSV